MLVSAGGSLAVPNGAGLSVMDLVSGGQSVLGSAPAARLLEAITVPPIWVPDEAAAGIAAATRNPGSFRQAFD